MSRKVAWISTIKTNEKPWGSEKTWTSTARMYNKIIKIEKGHRTSLKRYTTKSESFYLLSGKLSVLFGDEKTTDPKDMEQGILEEDQVLSVPSMCPYRLEALEDSVIMETSDYAESPYEILEDDYDR